MVVGMLIGATGWAATLTPVASNVAKCGTSAPLAVQEWEVSGSCDGPTSCSYRLEVPMDT